MTANTRISLGDAVTQFCGQDAFTRQRLARAADAILIPATDGRYGGSPLSFSEFLTLRAFLNYVADEFEFAGILRRDSGQPDNVAVSSLDGSERLVLSGGAGVVMRSPTISLGRNEYRAFGLDVVSDVGVTVATARVPEFADLIAKALNAYRPAPIIPGDIVAATGER